MRHASSNMRWWRLSREEATRLAHEHVERQGLPWTEPVSVSRTPIGGWTVMTNAGMRGGNVYLEISRRGRIRGGTRVALR